ncbi:MAG TPA: cupin domain-containing protein [Candidatus Methylomirabilis sp.]|nr:cupin domain-containing protein [Candidatus Methylomirabilis sp.]
MVTPRDLRAVPTVQIDDATVRVTEWRFAPGAATGWHRHEYPYVVVPMTTGRLAIAAPGGSTTAELVTGRPYARAAGVEHDVVNANDYEFVFIEVEIKGQR